MERHLGEKRTRQLEDLVGTAQFLDFGSRALMHSRSSVLTPSRSPRSTSSRLTQSNSVCGVELIIGAIDSAAAHIDGCSLGCSRTKRIARSRTSGENLLGFLFMARFSRESEPPQNPVWSTSHLRRDDMTIKHFIGTVHRRTVARTFQNRGTRWPLMAVILIRSVEEPL